MFGQSTGFGQSAGGGGGLFGQPPTASSGGLFGGGASTGGFGAQSTPGGFGALGMQPQQQPQTPIFGGAGASGGGLFGGTSAAGTGLGGGGLFGSSAPAQSTGGFGQPSTGGGFGNFGGGANAPLNQGASGGFGTFSQAQQKPAGFGGASGFGQTSQVSAGFGGGVFGGTSASGFGQPQSTGFGAGLGGGAGLSTFGQQQQQTTSQQTLGQQQASPFSKGFYVQEPKPQQTITTWNVNFQGHLEIPPQPQLQPGQKAPAPQQQQFFHNIKIEKTIDNLSQQMLRVIDMIVQKSNGAQTQPNYEFLAMQEFQQTGPQQYKFYQQQQQAQQTAAAGGFGQTPGAGGLFGGQGTFGQANPQGSGGGLFGATSQGGFGQTQGGFGSGLRPNASNQLGFGATTGIGASGGGFGTPGFNQNASFGASTGLGGGGLFGAQSQGIGAGFGGAKPFGQTTTQGGLFGQTSQPATGFGGAGGFGAPAQGSGGLFGGQQSTPNQQFGSGGGGLFGQPQQNQPAGGGLFGQPQQQQNQPAGGGLFGQPQQQQQPGGGLFGQKPAAQGGLFGQPQQQQNQPAGGGLFGQPQQQQQPGGLFGAGAQQQPAGGGLFGQTQPQGGGLFGSGQQQQQQQPGGLFGNAGQQQQQPAGGGLFGNLGAQNQQQQQPGQAAGGLFGAGAQQQSAGGGLFGAKPAAQGGLFGGGAQQPSGGLFGQPQQQQQPGGGLFGAGAQPQGQGLFGAGGAQQQQPAGSSLFGGAAAKPAGTGLFGQPAAQGSSLFGGGGQQMGGGMFGNTPGQGQSTLFGGTPQGQTQPGMQFGTQPNQMQQMQQQQQLYNPYMNIGTDPYGLRDALPQESPFANIDAELEKLKQESLKNPANNPYKDISITTSTIPTTTKNGALKLDDLYSTVAQSDEYELERDQQNAHLMKKYQQIYSQDEDTSKFYMGKGGIVQQTKHKQMYNPVKGYVNQAQSGFKVSQARTSAMSGSLYGQGRYSRPSYAREQEDDIKDYQEDITQAKQSSIQANKDLITVQLVVPELDDYEEQVIPIQIHQSRDVADIQERANQIITENQLLPEEDYDFVLLYRNHILNKTASLKQEGIVADCQVYVCVQKKNYQSNKKEQVNLLSDDSRSSAAPPSEVQKHNSAFTDKLAPKEMLPTQPKQGYTTIPSYLDIIRMTMGEMQRVKDFTIENEFGKIEFVGETDLTQVDLYNIVTIEKGSAEVYDDENPNTVKPPVGQKLNKPAIITLYDQDLTSQKTQEGKISVYKKHCEKRDSLFISYDSNKVLKFKVFHFTKYNFEEDDSEQQQVQEERVYENLDDELLDQSVDSYRNQDFDQQKTFPSFRSVTSKGPALQPAQSIGFSRQFSKQQNEVEKDSMFTTQLAKSNTQFHSQQPGFTTFKQTQIPSYQEPLKIEQRQQTIQNQASSGLPQRQISNLFEGKQSSAFGSGIYKTQISYANVPKPAAKGILDQISDTDSQFYQQQVQEDVDMDQLSEQSKKRRRLITDKFIADDEISILSGREDQDQQMIQDDGQSIRSEQVKDVSKAKTYKQILQRGSDKMSDVVSRQDLDIRNINQTKLTKAQEIMKNVRVKTQSFNDVRVFNKDIKRLSAQEAEKVFTDMGIVLPQKKLVQHSKVLPMRPIFAPNGNLITVKQNSQQVHITQIPLNSNIPLKEERQAYKNLSEVFLKHTTFKEDILDPNLGLRFDQLNLQNLGQDQLNHLVPQSFDDPYFEKLLATLKVHTLELKSNPTELFYFFEDLIIHNISQIQDCEKQISKLAPNMQAPQKLTLQSLTTLKQKLQEEFYVICTLNALYGNPCIHLVQLHHKFTGVRNYEKAKRVFGLQNDQNLMGMKASKEYDDAHTFKNEKQRRNALTEVIRFMCQQEYTLPPQQQHNMKLPDSSNVYQIAQHHLFNGDLKACLEHLNQNKKHKMAMFITQCMSSTSANDNMRDQFAHNNAFYKNFSAQAMELVHMMIGSKDLSSQLGKGQEKQWARLLCYYLTIKVKPNTEFSSLLRQFDNEVYTTYEGRQVNQQQHFASNLLLSQQRQQQQQQSTHSFSLVYFLIKLYASQKQETTKLIKDHLNTFQRIKPTSLHNVQDYRLQLITVMSLYYLQRHYRMHESKYQHRVEGFVIPDTVLANCAVQYTHQLLRQGDWQQALLAAQIIPKKSIKIKKQLIFYILQVHALHLTNHTSLLSNHKYVKEKLRISKDLVHVVRAFAFQYRYHNELALNEWIECKNLVAANNILNQRILPLYFRINYQNRNAMDYLNSHEKLIIDTFERLIKAQKGQVDQALILDITQNNPVYLFVTRFLSQVLKQGDKLKSEDIEKIIRDIASTLGFQEKLQADNMQRFIWEILVEYDRLQKISNVQKQASGQLKNQYGSRAQQNFEPMLELVNLYAENPIIIRNLDQFTMQSLPTLICNQV